MADAAGPQCEQTLKRLQASGYMVARILDAAKSLAKGHMPILRVAKLKVSHADSVVESSVSYAKAVARLKADDSNFASDSNAISDDEIKTLYGLATPAERTLILLGLNCAFGAGKIGNRRIPYVNFDVSEINGIRFKTGNDTRHHLWAETLAALRWELERRACYPGSIHSEDFFFCRFPDLCSRKGAEKANEFPHALA